MRYTLLKLVFITLLTMIFPFKSYAWNSVGHELVADIAYQQLTPSVRSKVDDLVSQLHKEYPEITTYAQMAYWADTLRGQKIETFSHWHYIDYSFSNDGTPLKDIIDTDNAAWATNTIKLVVKNPHANVFERARFLAFLTHIVGDLHQPLHTVSYFSKDHLDGDKGGNYYKVMNKGQHPNMHSLWDEGLGAFSGDNSDDRLKALSNNIMARYPATYFGSRMIEDLKTESWTKEGMNNAINFVYTAPEEKELTPAYIEAAVQTSEMQVALAGYRLGVMLNSLLA